MVIYCNCQEPAIKDNISNGDQIYICNSKKCNYIFYLSDFCKSESSKLCLRYLNLFQKEKNPINLDNPQHIENFYSFYQG